MKQPNELSFKKANIRLYTQTFVMKPSLGKTKQVRRSLQETTRIWHDRLTVNLIVILRISVMLII